MKNIAILGASGSIGRQTIDVIKEHPDQFNLVGVTVHNNTDFLLSLLNDFPNIKYPCVTSDKRINDERIIYDINKIISSEDVDIVVNAIAGIEGLYPSIETIKNDKVLCLANKETIILGGDPLIALLDQHPNSLIIPLDSEHNSLLQLLQGEKADEVDKLIITASGGPFKNYSIKELENVTVEQAINHPTWKMGKKISIDSATLFNKGLEILEVHYLFGYSYKDIDVVINPTSNVHAIVSFKDGTSKLLLSTPDMKLPILYGLAHGDRLTNSVPKLDITKLSEIKFEQIDDKKFPSVSLAYKAGFLDGNAPLIYCVANEVAVDAFMNNKIKFTDIYDVVEEEINNANILHSYSLSDIPNMVEEIKNQTNKIIERRTK